MENIKPRLYRRRDSARVLGCSDSQVVVFERRGLLKSISLEGLGARMKRNDAAEVDALAERLIAEAKAGR